MVGKTILIVDENEASRIFLVNALREKQFTILEASSGKEGLIFAWRDHPDLILFIPILTDLTTEDFVQKLHHDSRTNKTPIVALSNDSSPVAKEICLKAGVSEYLVKSPEVAVPVLEETFNRFLGIELPAIIEIDDGEKEKGLMIVFLSAKGGTGTSSLCVNLAMNIKVHQPDASVVVVDLVLPIGSIAQIVGNDEKLNLVTVADLPLEQTTPDYFHKKLPQPELWKFQLLAGSPDPQHGNILKGDRIEKIIDVLRVSYDFIILDIGRSLSRISLPLIQQADLISLIVSTDQSTVHLTKTVWEYLQAQGMDAQRIDRKSVV